MAKDLTIRLLGRPQVTKDDQVGYQRIVRQYVVEGYRASYAGINDVNNPLFLAVGTEDEEFTGHYLVNHKITPKQGSVDTAFLVREFVEIRNAHVLESVTTSNDLRRIRRTYVVLRAVSPTGTNIGYSAGNFAKHPQTSGGYEPWEYTPELVVDPSSATYTSSSFQVGGKTPTLARVEDENLSYPSTHTTLSGQSTYNNGVWLKGSAQVSMSKPGVDVWSVEWVTHSNSYNTSQPKKTGGSSFKVPNIVELDENGVRVSDFGGSGSSSQISQVTSNVAFFVDDQVPTSVSSYWGGSANYSPSVKFDFVFHRPNGQRIAHSQLFKNTVYQLNTDRYIKFNDANGNSINIGEKTGYEIVMEGSFEDLRKDSQTVPVPSGDYDSSGNELYQFTTIDVDNLYDRQPHYQKLPLEHAGGKISYTARFSSNANYATLIGVTAAPIFTSSDKNETRKIWKVVTTYAG